MKIFLKSLFLITVLGCLICFSLKIKQDKPSALAQSNISFLRASADPEGGTVSLTGPRENVDCAQIGTGSKEVCKCENSHSCTDSDCF